MTPLILFVSLAGAIAAQAQNQPQEQAPVGVDGQLPPALRNRPPVAPPAAGAALRAQALAKLAAQFRAADLDGNGKLSHEEAKGFGFVARHFDAIDTGRRGAVSFDDLRAYLEQVKAERR